MYGTGFVLIASFILAVILFDNDHVGKETQTILTVFVSGLLWPITLCYIIWYLILEKYDND